MSHNGLSMWRRLGPHRGTAAVARVATHRATAPFLARRLRRRPLRADAADVRIALGDHSGAEALRGPALAALRTVAAFERELEALTDGERHDLTARADALVAHRFDMLGSGEVDLGPDIDWHRDFKSGRRWPLEHMYKVPTSFPDGSDIHVPWELSRFTHLPLLAAAGRVSGDRRYVEEVGRQLDSWIAANPVGFGVNWQTTMNVGIRSANWVAALALCAETAQGEPWLDRALGSLLLHGRFIRRHPQRRDPRNNKYLCALGGLLAVAAVFSGAREGRTWVAWAARELVREMDHQVGRDGAAFEASTTYHRLSCEVMVCGTQALEALGEPLPGWFHDRLDRMLGFTADYTRPDGLGTQIGDGGNSRFLPLGDYGRADHRCHLHLFTQAEREPQAGRGHVAYPDGGFYIMRLGGLYAIVRCGSVGSDGFGWHAHNDQLAFELALGTQPIVIDPGTYVYTTDPEARNQFRSTAFHSTLQIGDEEQNALYRDNLFLMRDRSRAEMLQFEAGAGCATFEGRHHGFESLDPPATHVRRIEIDRDAATLTIDDTVIGEGDHLLQWTFPLAPCAAEADGNRAVAEFDETRLTVQGDGLRFAVEDGWYSPSYGLRLRTPFLRARRRARPGRDVTRFRLAAERL